MPYVTEQLQFNLNKQHGQPNNQPTLRQPAPLVLSHYGKDSGNMSQSMEMAVTLARRDIRLRNVTPLHDDLDTIPVKEISELKPIPKIPVGSKVRKSLRVNPAVAPIPKSKQMKNTSIVLMPAEDPVPEFDENITQTERQSVIVMIEALSNIRDKLARPNSKKLFPDPIEEARYERRAEAQRRNLNRVLYNAKRHTVQLVTFLERTAFIHRVTVLKQSSIMGHLLNAHRSLMNALGVFLKGAQMLNSAFMKEQRKDVVREVEVLLEEFYKVADLLDIQTQTCVTTDPGPEPEGSDQENTVPQLKIVDIRKSNPPLSPERDESLRAALRSLVKTSILQKKNSTPPPPVSDEETESPVQRTTHIVNDMLHKTAAKKPAMKHKNKLKPKSVPKSGNKKKRPTTAAPNSHKIRSLGNIKKSDVERPCSAPLIGNGQYVSPYSNIAEQDIPLMIRGGQLTPYITERELARQAWLDKLSEEQQYDQLDSLQSNVPSSSRTDLSRTKTPSRLVKSPFKAVAKGAEMSTTMVQLLDKLEEIEKEEDEIRNRWLHIQYSDPYQSTEPIILPSAELLAGPSTLLEDSPAIYVEQCKDSGPADITLPSASVKKIESYKKATQRHLTLTRHNKTADFDPWATINSMVDNIVDKLVMDVCGELLQTCDGLAENLYMSEFLPVEEQPSGLI